MAVSNADKRAAVALADSDLQLVLQESGAGLDTQYKVVPGIGLDTGIVEGRARIASIVVAWEAARDYDEKERELRAEARVVGQKRILQVQERQSMLRTVNSVHGKLNESESPSNEYLLAKAEQCEANEPLGAALDMRSSRKD